jgi:hypothetical protein
MQNDAIAGHDETCVLSRDVRVVEHEIVGRGAPDVHDLFAELERSASRKPLNYLEHDHKAFGWYAQGRVSENKTPLANKGERGFVWGVW